MNSKSATRPGGAFAFAHDEKHDENAMFIFACYEVPRAAKNVRDKAERKKQGEGVHRRTSSRF